MLKKKILSLFMVLVLVLVSSTSAFAYDDKGDINKGTEHYYEPLEVQIRQTTYYDDKVSLIH